MLIRSAILLYLRSLLPVSTPCLLDPSTDTRLWLGEIVKCSMKALTMLQESSGCLQDLHGGETQ